MGRKIDYLYCEQLTDFGIRCKLELLVHLVQVGRESFLPRPGFAHIFFNKTAFDQSLYW